MEETIEMAWWPRRKRGRHAITASNGNGQLANQAVDRAAKDLQETIKRGSEVDKIVRLVRREFGARS
jgi:hypothetical protein